MLPTDRHDVKSDRLVTANVLADLPEPVQRYMTYTGVVGKPWIDTVRLRQRGKFRHGISLPGICPMQTRDRRGRIQCR
jgi:hypothetical protein